MISPLIASTSNKVLRLDPRITPPSSEKVGAAATNFATDVGIFYRYNQPVRESVMEVRTQIKFKHIMKKVHARLTHTHTHTHLSTK